MSLSFIAASTTDGETAKEWSFGPFRRGLPFLPLQVGHQTLPQPQRCSSWHGDYEFLMHLSLLAQGPVRTLTGLLGFSFRPHSLVPNTTSSGTRPNSSELHESPPFKYHSLVHHTFPWQNDPFGMVAWRHLVQTSAQLPCLAMHWR